MAPAVQQHQTTSASAGNKPVQVMENKAPAAATGKKGKVKKGTDPADASKQIAAKIAQLELDAAGEKDQEAEIEREVKKANRALTDLLHGIKDPMDRLKQAQKKYADLYAEMKRTERDHAKAKKRADQLQKEKDTGRSELSKMTTMKDKLEKLSRDVTKENKKLKEDLNKQRTRESDMRQELHQRLEKVMADIDDAVGSKERPPEPQAVNMEIEEQFREKFRSFLEQYELREIHVQSLLRTKDLEIQLQSAKLEELRKERERESSKSSQLTRQVSTFSQTETELRQQLNIYVEKFKQVEDTLNNSNDLFLTFRKEMEEMSKKTKRLEKENLNLTRKQEATNRNIIEMAEERTRTQSELEELRKRNAQLEKLCRHMQAQGRGQVMPQEQEPGSDNTESDYEYEDEDEEGSDEGEYDEDTEEEEVARPFGPAPPPPPSANFSKANGRPMVNGQVNGVKH